MGNHKLIVQLEKSLRYDAGWIFAGLQCEGDLCINAKNYLATDVRLAEALIRDA
jgi:hypothetical protein